MSLSSESKGSVTVGDVRGLADVVNRMQNMLRVSTQWWSINRIMESKQGVLRVLFFLGAFQISQTECNTVFLSCGRKASLQPAAKLPAKRERKAAPIAGCEKLTF